MSPRPRVKIALLAAAASVALAAGLAACAPEPGETPQPTSSASESSPAASASPTPTAGATPAARAEIPDDCTGMLSDVVAAQLSGVPLNDPVLGVPTGTQPDGSLICIWRDPAADTTYLSTEITNVDRGPALDMLNDLAAEDGFTCYTPDMGTRCEKTWPNGEYPVMDGRTLFWRDGVLIDTKYSNLAPVGFTSAIVASIWG